MEIKKGSSDLSRRAVVYNMSKLAKLLSISRKIIGDYLLYMEEAGMIGQLRSATVGVYYSPLAFWIDVLRL